MSGAIFVVVFFTMWTGRRQRLLVRVSKPPCRYAADPDLTTRNGYGCRTSYWVDPFNVLKSEIKAKELCGLQLSHFGVVLLSRISSVLSQTPLKLVLP